MTDILALVDQLAYAWRDDIPPARANLVAAIESLRAERDSLLGRITSHNHALQAQCGVGDQEAVACKYRPYFEHSGRRCPNCPTDYMIEMGDWLIGEPLSA